MESQDQNKPNRSNKTLIIVIVVVIVVLAILGLIGRFAWSYFWGNVSEKASEEYAEEIIERSTGGDTEINIEQGEWPDNLDNDLQYLDSEVQSSSSYESGESEGVSVSLLTADSISQVYDYYVGLADKGWVVDYKFKSTRSDVGESASISLEKGDQSVAITINSEDGQSLIGMLATKENTDN
jgi:hypothetical protein